MHVKRIGFTPVKGGRHVAYDDVDLAGDGPVGDRFFCLVDLRRRRILRTVENQTLLQTFARWHAGVLSVTFPTGCAQGVPVATDEIVKADYWGRTATLRVVEGPWAAAYSAHLGYDVALAQAVSAGEVVYGASVTVLTTAAMRLLSERMGCDVPSERFRATFLVETGEGAMHPEDDWPGCELSLGEARVLVTGSVPRCGVVDLDALRGEHDLPVLRALAEYRRLGNEIHFGVEGQVTLPGLVRVGDPVALTAR